MTASADDIVGRYFTHLTAKDWESLGTVLDEGVVRVGPFGDQLGGRRAYLDFLRTTVPAEYGNDVLRIIGSSDGRNASARVTEHLHYESGELHLDEAYSFDIGEDGLISRVEIYWQTPQLDPGGFGSATSDESYGADESAGPVA